MASPFGLAYGIGAGLAGVPGAIEQGRERALAMSMRNLQLQQAQRQMQEQQGLDEALSMQVQPPTEQTPVYENMNTAESAPGVAAPAYRQEARGPYAPEELPGTMRVQTGTKETPHQWGSPYEQAAFELTKKAERLRQLGLGQSAQKMQEQALKYQGLHTESSLRDASRAILTGSYAAAIPTLNKIGMDIADIRQSPTNPESVTVVRNDGTEADIPKQTIQLIGMDPNKAMPLLETVQFRQKTLEQRAQQKELDRKAAMDRILARGDIQRDLAQYKVENPTAFKTADTAKIRNWEYQIAAEIEANPGMSVAEARKIVIARESPEAKGELKEGQELNALIKLVNDPTTPRAAREEYRVKVNELLRKDRGKRGTAAPRTPAALPRVTDRESYDKIPSGQQYIDPNGVTRTKG